MAENLIAELHKQNLWDNNAIDMETGNCKSHQEEEDLINQTNDQTEEDELDNFKDFQHEESDDTGENTYENADLSKPCEAVPSVPASVSTKKRKMKISNQTLKKQKTITDSVKRKIEVEGENSENMRKKIKTDSSLATETIKARKKKNSNMDKTGKETDKTPSSSKEVNKIVLGERNCEGDNLSNSFPRYLSENKLQTVKESSVMSYTLHCEEKGSDTSKESALRIENWCALQTRNRCCADKDAISLKPHHHSRTNLKEEDIDLSFDISGLHLGSKDSIKLTETSNIAQSKGKFEKENAPFVKLKR